jgi:DNA-binding response OmpR family regulator
MGQATADAAPRTIVAVLADDLIWASRLRAAIEHAGGQPVAAKDADEIGAALLVVIDLGGRAYDGIAAVRAAASAGATVLAVAQHDDVEVRKAALAAGAIRVLSYNKMFSDGPQVMERLMAGTL